MSAPAPTPAPASPPAPLPCLVRPAVSSDVPNIYSGIRDLAIFENSLGDLENTVERLTKDGFHSQPPKWFAFIAESADDSKTYLGHAFCYFAYSTWKGFSLYLDDLYVRPEYRSMNVGLELMTYVVQYSHDQGCQRVMWQALDWNEGAIRFYKKHGAIVLKEWLTLRFTREGMDKFLEARKKDKMEESAQ